MKLISNFQIDITEIENKFNDLNLNKPKDFLYMQNEESGQLYKLVFVGDSVRMNLLNWIN